MYEIHKITIQNKIIDSESIADNDYTSYRETVEKVRVTYHYSHILLKSLYFLWHYLLTDCLIFNISTSLVTPRFSERAQTLLIIIAYHYLITNSHLFSQFNYPYFYKYLFTSWHFRVFLKYLYLLPSLSIHKFSMNVFTFLHH